MLTTGFRGHLYNDNEPLYCTTLSGWFFNRRTRKYGTAQSLATAMYRAGYSPTVNFETAGGGGFEVGIPSLAWQKAHPWAKWGDPKVQFPDGPPPVEPEYEVLGPYTSYSTTFFIQKFRADLNKECMVWLDVDEDPDPDVALTKQQVCDGEIADRVKKAIHAQLLADGCGGLPCVEDD